jgi:hypothetical protein
MMGGSITMEMNAPPDVVWQVATDSENLTTILTNLLEYEEITKDDDFRTIGKVVRQKRIILGKEEENFITFTGVQEDSLPYSLTYNIYITLPKLGMTKDEAVRTGSWTIVQGENEHKAVFIWTYSQIAGSLLESLATLFCGSCMIRSIQRHFQQDLRDYAKEAERRQSLKDKEIIADRSSI